MMQIQTITKWKGTLLWKFKSRIWKSVKGLHGALICWWTSKQHEQIKKINNSVASVASFAKRKIGKLLKTLSFRKHLFFAKNIGCG